MKVRSDASRTITPRTSQPEGPLVGNDRRPENRKIRKDTQKPTPGDPSESQGSPQFYQRTLTIMMAADGKRYAPSLWGWFMRVRVPPVAPTWWA